MKTPPPPRTNLNHLPIRSGTLQPRLDSSKGVSQEEITRQAQESAFRTGVRTGEAVRRPDWASYQG